MATMTTCVGINGFDRIGRQSLRAALERYPQDMEIVAIIDITDSETNAHLFRYDSTYGRFNGAVEVARSDLVINGWRIKVFAQPEGYPCVHRGAAGFVGLSRGRPLRHRGRPLNTGAG